MHNTVMLHLKLCYCEHVVWMTAQLSHNTESVVTNIMKNANRMTTILYGIKGESNTNVGQYLK